MRKVLLCLMVTLLSANLLLAENRGEKLNVMSYNIRYDNPNDLENQWKYRKNFAANLIKFYNVDMFGAQEVLYNQLIDLTTGLPDFDYIGVGREDGMTKGEYAPIFYKKDRFTVVKSGNFWLAEDMNAVGKKGWDAACERVATWAVFRDKATNQEFFFLNTHLDHMGKTARHEGASLVLEQAKVLSGGLPILITGDFNAAPGDEPIQVLTDPKDPRHLIHSRDMAALKYGPEWTFHNFGKIPYQQREWIDYIFLKGDVEVLSHGVLTDTLNNLYPSDHCPIICTLVL